MKRTIGWVVCGMVVAGMLGAGAACGGTLAGVKAAAEMAGPNGMIKMLVNGGVTNAVERAAVTNAWDEDVFVDTVVKHRAWEMVYWAVVRDTLSATNRTKIKTALLAEVKPTSFLVEIVKQYPVAERADFKGALERYVTVFGGAQPEWMKVRIKYAVLQGIGDFGDGVDEADLIRVLVAREPATLGDVLTMKKALKARAVRLARQGLRAEGKSFVVKDAVNPLEVKVRPVIDALNAPECSGIEAAFRGLGSAVQDADRTGLAALTAGWGTKIMSGEIGGGDAAAFLGKIAVVLGADGYNRLVDEYNNGTAGGK